MYNCWELLFRSFQLSWKLFMILICLSSDFYIKKYACIYTCKHSDIICKIQCSFHVGKFFEVISRWMICRIYLIHEKCFSKRLNILKLSVLFEEFPSLILQDFSVFCWCPAKPWPNVNLLYCSEFIEVWPQKLEWFRNRRSKFRWRSFLTSFCRINFRTNNFFHCYPNFETFKTNILAYQQGHIHKKKCYLKSYTLFMLIYF